MVLYHPTPNGSIAYYIMWFCIIQRQIIFFWQTQRCSMHQFSWLIFILFKPSLICRASSLTCLSIKFFWQTQRCSIITALFVLIIQQHAVKSMNIKKATSKIHFFWSSFISHNLHFHIKWKQTKPSTFGQPRTFHTSTSTRSGHHMLSSTVADTKQPATSKKKSVLTTVSPGMKQRVPPGWMDNGLVSNFWPATNIPYVYVY